MDIVMSRIKNGYLIRARTEKGNALVSSKILSNTDEYPHKQNWPKDRYPLAAPEAFLDFYSDDLWREIMPFCLTCGICTLGCPTCTCFRIVDESYKDQGERLTIWDSCQFRSYSRMAAGHNPRAKTIERIKNRILDKFAYSFLRYGRISCTGCGRCVASCPVHCSLPEAAAFISNGIKQRLSGSKLPNADHGSGIKK
jgi:ferredoxin